ncbi:MAG: thiamine diphosphokinase [Synergistetes bacterium]|nr:thiamine diphosphokinase [Synergistota bacterium]
MLEGADLIICADGGGNYLYAWGVKPDILIGDMDSISAEALLYFEGAGVKIVRFPRDKDYTDSHLALLEALRFSPSEVIIIGGLGDRMDHNIANIHLLYLALKRGVRAKLVNERYEAIILKEGENRMEISGEKISLLPLTSKVIFSRSEGLKWKLDDLTFSLENPIGISNEPLGKEVIIDVKEGYAILFQVKEG